MERLYWLSPLGGFDDFDRPYGNEVGSVMYDAKTNQGGMWANMTQESFDEFGCGKLGTGFGQKYELESDGKWYKVAG